jgi:hypothetical protein
MSKIFNIKIKAGDDIGPYDIKYKCSDGIEYFAFYNTTTIETKDVSLAQLTLGVGVQVIVPDCVVLIFLDNKSSGTKEECDITFSLITPTPTPTTTATPTNTPTTTITPTQTPSISLTPTSTPTISITKTPTKTPTNTPTSFPKSNLCISCEEGYEWFFYTNNCCFRIDSIPANSYTKYNSVNAPNATYSTKGTIFYDNNFNIDGTGPILTTSQLSNIWANIENNTFDGPLNRTAIWGASGGLFPTNIWAGKTFCINNLSPRIYWVGIGGNDSFRISLDGLDIVNTLSGLANYDNTDNLYRYWHIYPISVGIGFHTLELFGLSKTGNGGFGFEVYNVLTVDDLVFETNIATLQSKIFESSSNVSNFDITQDLEGAYLPNGFSCPTGYIYSECSNSCQKFVTCCPTPTPTPTNTQTPPNTQTPTNTETNTQTPTNTETNTPTPTNTPTNTQTPTNSKTPTNTQTPTNTNTPTNTETPTNTPTNTETPTNTPTNTKTPTNTPTNTKTSTPTNTETQTNTPTNTETPTNTSTNTQTPTNTKTPTKTPTNTPTNTKTPTNTPTNTKTPTNTPSSTKIEFNPIYKIFRQICTPTPTPSQTKLRVGFYCNDDITHLLAGGVTYCAEFRINLDPTVDFFYLTADALTEPDRFIVYFDGNIVIDTGYISTQPELWGYPGREAERSNFKNSLNGRVDEVTNLQYPNAGTSDSAPDGYPNVGPNLTSVIDPGTGRLTYSFFRTSNTSFATVRVCGPLATTIWRFTLVCVPGVVPEGFYGCGSVVGSSGDDIYPQTFNILLDRTIDSVVCLRPTTFDDPDRFVVKFDNIVVIDTEFISNDPNLYTFGGLRRNDFIDVSNREVYKGFTTSLRGRKDARVDAIYPSRSITIPRPMASDDFPFVFQRQPSYCFHKNTNTNFVTVEVYAPLGATNWNFIIDCPVENVMEVILLGQPTITIEDSCKNRILSVKYIEYLALIDIGLEIFNDVLLDNRTYNSNPGGYSKLVHKSNEYVVTFDSIGKVSNFQICPTATPTPTPTKTSTPTVTRTTGLILPSNTPTSSSGSIPYGYNCPCDSLVPYGLYSTIELCLATCFPSPEETPAPTPTVSVTSGLPPSITPTKTSTPPNTPTNTPTPTVSTTSGLPPSNTPSITPTKTSTPPNTPTNTPTPTVSATSGLLPSNTPTTTKTPTPIPQVSVTPTRTPQSISSGYNCPCETLVPGGLYSSQGFCLSVCFPSPSQTPTPTSEPTPQPTQTPTPTSEPIPSCVCWSFQNTGGAVGNVSFVDCNLGATSTNIDIGETIYKCVVYGTTPSLNSGIVDISPLGTACNNQSDCQPGGGGGL